MAESARAEKLGSIDFPSTVTNAMGHIREQEKMGIGHFYFGGPLLELIEVPGSYIEVEGAVQQDAVTLEHEPAYGCSSGTVY